MRTLLVPPFWTNNVKGVAMLVAVRRTTRDVGPKKDTSARAGDVSPRTGAIANERAAALISFGLRDGELVPDLTPDLIAPQPIPSRSAEAGRHGVL